MAAADAMAVAVHTLAYLTVMALAAWVVYRKLGLSLLRTAWFNMDWVWAALSSQAWSCWSSSPRFQG